MDQAFPENSLTPDDQNLKQEAMQWEQFADEELGSAVRRVCYNTLLNHPDTSLLTLQIMAPGMESSI